MLLKVLVTGSASHRSIEVQFAFEDLLIGSAPLHLAYEVEALNLHDFKRIPGPLRDSILND